MLGKPLVGREWILEKWMDEKNHSQSEQWRSIWPDLARPGPKMSPRTPHMLCVLTTRQRQWLRPCDTAPDEGAGSKASHGNIVSDRIDDHYLAGFEDLVLFCLPVTEL
jgi:hypothetical protein